MKKWYYIDYRFDAADRSLGENNRLRQGESKTEKKKTNGFSRVCFRIIRKIVYIVYPKIKTEGLENLPDEPCIFVGNHTQMNGPIICELYSPVPCRTWCAGQMMNLKEVPAYAYADFWSGKPKYIRWLYKILSYIIAPLSVCVFNNANTIAVYRDNRIISTFRNTVSALMEGSSVVVFPECYDEYNNIVNRFQEKFVDVARIYYRKTGKAVKFVPVYIAPKLKTMYFGTPTEFDPETNINEERHRICTYLMNEITDIAVNLPLHTVVPYSNISKKYYPTNIPCKEACNDEKAGS